MLRRALALTAAAGLIAGAAPGLAGPRKAKLSIARGALTLSGNKLSGAFRVTNGGSKAASATTASLVLIGPNVNRTLHSYRVKWLGSRHSAKIKVSLPDVLTGLAAGSYVVSVCVAPGGGHARQSAMTSCRVLDIFTVKSGTPSPNPPTTPVNPSQPTTPTQPVGLDTPKSPPCSTPDCAPAANYKPDTVFSRNDADGQYWVFVPSAYSPTTPIQLLVTLHGCGGASNGQAWTAADYNYYGAAGPHWITIAPDGADGGCWNLDTGPARIRTAILDAIARFNINPRRVVLEGYSAGGDLAYRLAWTHSKEFAGVLAINTSPFRDTGLTASQALADATWKFNVWQWGHICDDTYPQATVSSEVQQMRNAGWDTTVLQFDETPGHHWDENAATAGTQTADITHNGACSGAPESTLDTTTDLQTQIKKGMAKNWLAPAN